jgi:enediyne biosynthesis protein E4
MGLKSIVFSRGREIGQNLATAGKPSLRASRARWLACSPQAPPRPAPTALVLLGLAGFLAGCDSGPIPDPAGEIVATEASGNPLWALRADRARRDATVWEIENRAQEFENSLVALWDDLLEANRAADPKDKFRILAEVGLGELVLGTPTPHMPIDHGIESNAFSAPLRSLDNPEWQRLLEKLEAEGYELVQSEWHHARFTPPGPTAPARSQVAVVLHGIHRPSGRRIVVDGELGVEWAVERDPRGNPIPARVDASNLRVLGRAAAPAFRKIDVFDPVPEISGRRIHPLVVYDLDKNGFDDLILIGVGRVLWNRDGREFRVTSLVEQNYPLAEAAAVADFNGDAHPDLLATRASGDVAVYWGDGKGRFPEAPRLTPRIQSPLQGPSSIAVGDIDGDGDLDAWLGQYKPPYVGGQMPTPFFDANDGWASYLLNNDGQGRFVLGNEAAGLTEKRFRRTYASAFVDLDADGDLDLLVISDFSGVDLYHNDGRGHFVDANSTVSADRHLFGMSGALADYDLDGRLDFFVAGMGSTTARRMEAAGLHREDRPAEEAMRMRMGYGNRMYLADDNGWRQPEFHLDVARTGWTWGTTAFDFDNDGDPDIFAANGHESGESTQDYCSTFWRHDIFDADSKPNKTLETLFSQEMTGFASGQESWDGYQKNHLLLNQSGRAFLNVAFLLGVADEFDSRSAISADLDRDGRVDLIVVEDRGEDGERLHVYRNEIATENNWIGVELVEEGAGVSPVGASIRVRAGDRTLVRQLVVGESLMGQHPNTLHFGLGTRKAVDSVEVRWTNGKSRTLSSPGINRYHRLSPAAPGKSPAPTRPTA